MSDFFLNFIGGMAKQYNADVEKQKDLQNAVTLKANDYAMSYDHDIRLLKEKARLEREQDQAETEQLMQMLGISTGKSSKSKKSSDGVDTGMVHPSSGEGGGMVNGMLQPVSYTPDMASGDIVPVSDGNGGVTVGGKTLNAKQLDNLRIMAVTNPKIAKLVTLLDSAASQDRAAKADLRADSAELRAENAEGRNTVKFDQEQEEQVKKSRVAAAVPTIKPNDITTAFANPEAVDRYEFKNEDLGTSFIAQPEDKANFKTNASMLASKSQDLGKFMADVSLIEGTDTAAITPQAYSTARRELAIAYTKANKAQTLPDSPEKAKLLEAADKQWRVSIDGMFPDSLFNGDQKKHEQVLKDFFVKFDLAPPSAIQYGFDVGRSPISARDSEALYSHVYQAGRDQYPDTSFLVDKEKSKMSKPAPTNSKSAKEAPVTGTVYGQKVTKKNGRWYSQDGKELNRKYYNLISNGKE